MSTVLQCKKSKNQKQSCAHFAQLRSEANDLPVYGAITAPYTDYNQIKSHYAFNIGRRLWNIVK